MDLSSSSVWIKSARRLVFIQKKYRPRPLACTRQTKASTAALALHEVTNQASALPGLFVPHSLEDTRRTHVLRLCQNICEGRQRRQRCRCFSTGKICA